MAGFRFQSEPFPDARGDGWLFPTPAISQRLVELHQCIEHRHALLVDEAGSGKSTLLARLGEEGGPGLRTARLVAVRDEGVEALLARLVVALDLPRRQPAAAQLRDLDAFLEVIAARRQLAVLMLDQAESLGTEALEFLLYLTRRWKALPIRFVMGAQPDLERRLAAHPQGRRVLDRACVLRMPRLSLAEVDDYLHMRLHRAGLEGDSPFTADVVGRLAALSGGRPGVLHPLARRIVEGASRSTPGARGSRLSLGLAGRWGLALLVVAAAAVVILAGHTGVRSPRIDAVAGGRQGGFHSSISPATERPP